MVDAEKDFRDQIEEEVRTVEDFQKKTGIENFIDANLTLTNGGGYEPDSSGVVFKDKNDKETLKEELK